MDNSLLFYNGKRVFITGCSGFKGTWMCELLSVLGADVCGYALESPTYPSLFELLNIKEKIVFQAGDISDLSLLKKIFDLFEPEIVIHMAAQPLVRESYKNPCYTYHTNVMGTVSILECCRLSDSVKSVINVTTDKVYKNNEWCWGYRETDELNGYDPYSNSKSCSELVTSSYTNSFLKEKGVAVSTVRAGNVIGGGDFSADRIVPDCVRALGQGKKVVIRNPYSVRPFQHVIEPIVAYLMIAQNQYNDLSLSGCYNIGPDEKDCITVGKLADIFCELWGDDASWIDVSEENAPHEANFLKLDCSKIKSVFGWDSKWDITESLKKTVEWYKAFYAGEEMLNKTIEQIKEYIG